MAWSIEWRERVCCAIVIVFIWFSGTVIVISIRVVIAVILILFLFMDFPIKKYNEAQLQNAPNASTIESPFQYSGESLDEYVTKANLSPWTPVPDSVARKIFDNAMPSSDDVS